MSHTLLVKKTGLYAKEWIYDKKKKEGSYVERFINPEDVLYELHTFIEEVEETFTLRDYFKLVIQYRILMLLDPFFLDFLKEYKKCPKSGCKKRSMPTLRLKRSICVEITKGKVDAIENFIEFNGTSRKPDDTSWAVEFTPLADMLDTPLRIEKMDVHITRFGGAKHFSTKTYTNPDVEYMRLFSFVTEPIWELSFCGTPTQRNKQEKELNKTIKDVKSGKAKLYPLDLKKLKEGVK